MQRATEGLVMWWDKDRRGIGEVHGILAVV